MKRLMFLVLASAAFLAACEDPAANKPKATTTNSTSNAIANTQTNSDATTNSFETMEVKGTALPILPVNSKIEFTGSKVTGKHDGGFKDFRGVVDLVNNKAEDSKVSVEIVMDSLFTDTEDLTKHLKTGDFFEAEKYPKSTFVSTKIVADAAKGANNYTVTGDLEMHGTKKAVTFPATITVNDSAVEVKSEFSINRKDFQILYAGKADDLIRDDVVLRLDLKAPRK